MKRLVSLCLAVVFMLALGAVAGYCKGDLGIGYDGVVNGLSVKKWTSNDFGYQGILGLNYEAAQSGAIAPNDNGKLDLTVVARVLMAKDITDKVKLNCFGGVELQKLGSHTKDVGQTNIFVQAGVSPEIFLFSNLSVETSAGLQLSIIGETAKNAKDDYVKFGTFGAGVSVVSGVSFHYYL